MNKLWPDAHAALSDLIRKVFRARFGMNIAIQIAVRAVLSLAPRLGELKYEPTIPVLRAILLLLCGDLMFRDCREICRLDICGYGVRANHKKASFVG
jgi:hypothetical protein